MFTPKIPPSDTAPTPATSLVQPLAGITHTPACTCQHASVASAPVHLPAASSAPAARFTPGSLVLMAGGGTAVVLVVGAVLVSMLLATAITAASVALCAVVLRSLVNDQKGR